MKASRILLTQITTQQSKNRAKQTAVSTREKLSDVFSASTVLDNDNRLGDLRAPLEKPVNKAKGSQVKTVHVGGDFYHHKHVFDEMWGLVERPVNQAKGSAVKTVHVGKEFPLSESEKWTMERMKEKVEEIKRWHASE